jgi:U1 small nuclear ribonucleoprotein
MLMPPDIRITFMPNPPLEPIPPVTYRRREKWTGMAGLMNRFEKNPPPERIILPTPKTLKEKRILLKAEEHKKQMEPLVAEYRKEQRDCGGEYAGMNCYNTLFVGRLAYEVTERKLLREMEAFGPVKDIIIVKQDNKSRGYAFVEYEHEEDMKRAYRAADCMRIEGREVVVDVERGHTVPDWLPRRLGGGLGGTRLGGPKDNVTRPGRFDPLRPEASHPMPPMMPGPYGNGGPAPPPRYGGPPPPPPPSSREYDRYGGPPQPPRDYGDRRYHDRGGGDYSRKRHRSRSPDRYGGGGGARRR